MLTLDQKKRWTAQQLMDHPWIQTHEDELATRDISGVLKEMKRFNATKKFRAAATAVILSNRMGHVKSTADTTSKELGHMSTAFGGRKMSMINNEDILKISPSEDMEETFIDSRAAFQSTVLPVEPAAVLPET